MRKVFDGFVLALALTIGLAWIFPGPGSEGGWMHGKALTKAGVALVFFLHGANLSLAALKAGTMRWPLHLVVQGSTFLLFPLLGLLGLALGGSAIPADLRLGFFFLCALPSTVSSSVALTALARGNVPAAVFNASLSSLLGVFLTPLWVALVVKAGGQTLPLGQVILDLMVWLIVPFLVGNASRRWLGAFVLRHKKQLQTVDRGVILLIVYTSFCDSVSSGVWRHQGWSTLGVTLAVSAGLFFFVMMVTLTICRALKFPIEDVIVGVFCGSKKSLATGVPMAQVLFAGNPAIGVILLPIIVYHSFQLAVCAWLARHWGERKEPGESDPG